MIIIIKQRQNKQAHAHRGPQKPRWCREVVCKNNNNTSIAKKRDGRTPRRVRDFCGVGRFRPGTDTSWIRTSGARAKRIRRASDTIFTVYYARHADERRQVRAVLVGATTRRNVLWVLVYCARIRVYTYFMEIYMFMVKLMFGKQ